MRYLISIFAATIFMCSTSFAGGVLEIKCADCVGPAKGYVKYSKWDDTRQTYMHLRSRNLKKGANRAALSPGRYRVEVWYTGTLPPQTASAEEIVIEDGQEALKEFQFGRATLSFKSRDNDWNWGAESRAFLYQWDAPKGDFVLLRAREHSDRDWDDHFTLAPGRYKLRLQYLETMPQDEQAETVFDIADGQSLAVMNLFKHGPLPERRRFDRTKAVAGDRTFIPNEKLTKELDGNKKHKTPPAEPGKSLDLTAPPANP